MKITTCARGLELGMDAREPTDEILKYFVSEKNGIVVVSFIGPLTRHAANALESCLEEILSKSPRRVVLYMRDASATMERPLFPLFTLFQKTIREREAELRICGVHPTLRRELESQGIIRSEELVNNLQDALRPLPRN